MYDEIVSKYYTAILNYCTYKLDGNKSAAEDVTQEVFFTLYKKLNRLKMSENIKIWLYRAADKEIKTYRRKNPPIADINECLEMVTFDSYPDIEESAFSCLNDEEMALLLDYYSGESREKVAEEHGTNINSLYIRIYRIKKKLAENLEKYNKIT